jgi:lipopolysaccharide/colanic/teichoic acid biosynthesis glycosyltransferase/ADP-ribose pyrophosphatase YjhB (NUDIX family)
MHSDLPRDPEDLCGIIELKRPVYEVITRIYNAVFAGVALLALSPVFLLIGIASKVTSRGPIIYAGERTGKGGRPFRIYKLRTMVVGVDEALGELQHKDDDALYTPLGRSLRRWRLDELPQLFNVFVGDMNLVGPRPVRVALSERWVYEGYYISPRQRLILDLQYIAARSLLGDLELLLLTFSRTTLGEFLLTTTIRAGARMLRGAYTAGCLCVVQDPSSRLLLVKPRYRLDWGLPRLLLVKPRYRLDWGLPGGFMRRGEQPSEAVKRELREEIGLDLEPGSPVASYVQSRRPHIEYLFSIVLSPEQAALVAATSLELGIIRWFDRTESPPLQPEAAEALERTYGPLNREGGAATEDPAGFATLASNRSRMKDS